MMVGNKSNFWEILTETPTWITQVYYWMVLEIIRTINLNKPSKGRQTWVNIRNNKMTIFTFLCGKQVNLPFLKIVDIKTDKDKDF